MEPGLKFEVQRSFSNNQLEAVLFGPGVDLLIPAQFILFERMLMR